MKKVILMLIAIVMVAGFAIGCSNDNGSEETDKASEVELTFKSATTEDVKSGLVDKTWKIVDTRLNDAFNGWKMDGVSRGGRIKGATDFSANWLKVDIEDRENILKDILINKGITKEKSIVLYDGNGEDSKIVAQYLKDNGYEDIYIYDVNKWADDESLPMEAYENYERIVPASIVKSIIDGEKPETFEDAKDIKIVEASWGEEKTSYSKGHIPTAFHINTDLIEPPTTTEPIMWLLADNASLQKFAKDYGFTVNDTVIVTSEEPLASYRVATVLRYMGVQDVRVLNGGTSQWIMAGYELDTDSVKPVPVEEFGGSIPMNPDVFDTMDDVKSGLKNSDEFVLIDNRTWEEYVGESSGYSYHKKKGRIPGAVFGYAGKKDAYSLDYYRNPDKTMLNANEFLSRWQEQGIDMEKHMSFMCGSGWRVAEIFTYADVVGLKDISIFSDGWIGWSNAVNNPIETGDPNK